ncbi:ABC-three component system middle component 1 [Vulgatibacter incomptus]|uniref:ABC-three component system middle component 1 n=1 Tax=Vulgatibacter incomptus TaxID=1391653 RepID=UPI0012F7BB03|nr:ABC-three component system middle component 1 [Vulgatibacter incomptus]
MSMHPVNEMSRCLCEVARVHGRSAVVDPVKISERISFPGRSDASVRHESYFRSIDIDGYWVLIGDLGSDPSRAFEILLSFHWQAAALRSSRPAAEQDDVILYLVALGEPKKWQNVAGQIERDDRVCRKLVWVASEDSNDRNDSLNSFLQRTFLARPWASERADMATSLDAIGRALARIEPANFGVARRWVELLISDDAPASGRPLAERLLSSLEEEQP